MVIEEINISENEWKKTAIKYCAENHLICTGQNENLQWFGTQLIQEISKTLNAEVSPLYGKHINNIDDFCYQLCHSTPWGFEMGRNGNAIVDVLRGETYVENKLFIWHDVDNILEKDRDLFEYIFEIFLDISLESKETNQNLRAIFLIENLEKLNLNKLLKKKVENFVKILKINQFVCS